MKAVRCAACFPRSVAGQMIPLRYGVTIALCEDHRDPAFVHSRGGRDFLAALTTTFESLGLRGARYGKAIQASGEFQSKFRGVSSAGIVIFWFYPVLFSA